MCIEQISIIISILMFQAPGVNEKYEVEIHEKTYQTFSRHVDPFVPHLSGGVNISNGILFVVNFIHVFILGACGSFSVSYAWTLFSSIPVTSHEISNGTSFNGFQVILFDSIII